METFTQSAPVVNGTIVFTSDLQPWDDCPKCVYGQVHPVEQRGITVMVCLDNCGFVSAPN